MFRRAFDEQRVILVCQRTAQIENGEGENLVEKTGGSWCEVQESPQMQTSEKRGVSEFYGTEKT